MEWGRRQHGLHALRVAGDVVDVAVVSGIPLIEVLVQAVEPVGSGREVDDLLARDGVGDEDRDWVADEHITPLDIAPEEVPDIGLWRASLGDEVATDLDVGSVQDRAVRYDLLDQGDEARHLRVVNLYWSARPVIEECNVTNPPSLPRSGAWTWSSLAARRA